MNRLSERALRGVLDVARTNDVGILQRTGRPVRPLLYFVTGDQSNVADVDTVERLQLCCGQEDDVRCGRQAKTYVNLDGGIVDALLVGLELCHVGGGGTGGCEPSGKLTARYQAQSIADSSGDRGLCWAPIGSRHVCKHVLSSWLLCFSHGTIERPLIKRRLFHSID